MALEMLLDKFKKTQLILSLQVTDLQVAELKLACIFESFQIHISSPANSTSASIILIV